MNTLRRFFRHPRKSLRSLNRGSVLVLTLFIVTTLSLAVGSLVQLSMTEMLVNQRAILQLDANNAAEAASEFAMSSLKLRWDNQASFPANQFVNNPVTINSTVQNYLWGNSDIDAANVSIKTGLVPYATPIYIDTNDPANTFDPQRGKVVNACDVYVYTSATAKASLGSNTISATGYACQALEVRDAPLFSHAIFYNMDLEFHPGPNMTITGPVHSNGNIWAVAQSGLTFSGPITTSGTFNVGMMDWPSNWSSTNGAQTGALVKIPNGLGGYATPYKGSGSQTASSSYWDSRTTNFTGTGYTNWADFSANRWGGNLQTSANGVPEEKLSDFGDFVYHVNGTSQNLNYSYAFIEPNQFNPATNPYHKLGGEVDKFERKAGLIIKVHAVGTMNITDNVTLSGNYMSNSTTTNVTINSTLDSDMNSTVANWLTNGACKSASGNFVPTANVSIANGSMTLANGSVVNITSNSVLDKGNITANSTAFLLVTQIANSNTSTPGSTLTTGANGTTLMEGKPVGHYTAGSNTTTANVTRTVGFAYVEIENLETSVDSSTGIRTQVLDTTKAVVDGNGTTVYPGDVIPVPIAVNSSQITGTYNVANGTITPGIAQDLIRFNPSVINPSNSTDVWGGIYDARRDQTSGEGYLSTVRLDVGMLKSLVDDHVAGQSANAAAVFQDPTSGSQTFTPSDMYNGVVYVEFPQQAGNATRLNSVTAGNIVYQGDQVTDSIQNVGLMLTNATSTSTSTGVPNPTYNDPSIAGHAGRQLGFTVATNNCIYVDGNYNADGIVSTPLADTTANQQYNATMPDNPANPDPPCALVADSVTCLSGSWVNRKSKASSPNSATATEFNAAVVAGIEPSNPSTGSLSGGSHNFPRFLENWSGIDFRYRGSMVCLFESELANQPYDGNCYSPPNREWGFYDQFSKGNYPPGTPNARTYYRVGFQVLTKAQYTAATAGL